MKQKYNLVGKSIIGIIGAIGLTGTALADKPAENLKGCYRVEHAVIEESSIDANNVIGTYRLALSQGNSPTKHLNLSGPLKGNETDEGHVLGTRDRVGTLSTQGDSVTVSSVDCFNAQGTPQLVKGVETFRFYKGTGIFSGLTSGLVEFNLVFDACTNPGNPTADLQAGNGEICFQ